MIFFGVGNHGLRNKLGLSYSILKTLIIHDRTGHIKWLVVCLTFFAFPSNLTNDWQRLTFASFSVWGYNACHQAVNHDRCCAVKIPTVAGAIVRHPYRGALIP